MLHVGAYTSLFSTTEQATIPSATRPPGSNPETGERGLIYDLSSDI